MNGSFMPAAITDSNPRPSMVRANVPWVSSHARTHPAADDAFGRIEGEIRVRRIFFGVEVIGAVVAVSDLAQPHRAGHVLQFAMTVRGTGQAVERMIRDIEFHHAAAQIGEPAGLGPNLHACCYRCRTRCGCASAALDLNQAQPARTERFQAVCRTELRYLRSANRRGVHHRTAFGNLDRFAVYFEQYRLGRMTPWRSKVNVGYGLHRCPPALSKPRFPASLSGCSRTPMNVAAIKMKRNRYSQR